MCQTGLLTQEWYWIPNPIMTIFTHGLLNQGCLQDITINEIQHLLHVQGSYSEIEPQIKQILLNTHMTIIFKRPSEGRK